VHVVSRRAGGANLRRTDCAIIAPVTATKGLEFDAVVFLDVGDDWRDQGAHVDEIKKNALYVAASRAKQGLSLVMRSLPAPLVNLGNRRLCLIERST